MVVPPFNPPNSHRLGMAEENTEPGNAHYGPPLMHTPKASLRNHSFSLADKEQILRDIRSKDITPAKAMVKYGIKNASFVRDWTRRNDKTRLLEGLEGEAVRKKVKTNSSGRAPKYTEEGEAIQAYIRRYQGSYKGFNA